jgi:hypothetical protein
MIESLVHRENNRFVSTDTAQMADQSRPHLTPRHERYRVCEGGLYSRCHPRVHERKAPAAPADGAAGIALGKVGGWGSAPNYFQI